MRTCPTRIKSVVLRSKNRRVGLGPQGVITLHVWFSGWQISTRTCPSGSDTPSCTTPVRGWHAAPSPRPPAGGGRRRSSTRQPGSSWLGIPSRGSSLPTRQVRMRVFCQLGTHVQFGLIYSCAALPHLLMHSSTSCTNAQFGLMCAYTVRPHVRRKIAVLGPSVWVPMLLY